MCVGQIDPLAVLVLSMFEDRSSHRFYLQHPPPPCTPTALRLWCRSRWPLWSDRTEAEPEPADSRPSPRHSAPQTHTPGPDSPSAGSEPARAGRSFSPGVCVRTSRDHVFVYLYGWGVDLKLLKDGEGLFVQFVADGDVGDVGSVVIVQPVDVLHDPRPVRFDGRQDQQVLQVPDAKDTFNIITYIQCLIYIRSQLHKLSHHVKTVLRTSLTNKQLHSVPVAQW